MGSIHTLRPTAVIPTPFYILLVALRCALRYIIVDWFI